MNNIKAVIFDVDGTLTKRLSWLFLTEKLGASTDKHAEMLNGLRSGKYSLSQATKQLVNLWKDTGNANKSSFRKTFDSVPLRSESIDIINYLKNRGYLLCLITGSMDLYAKIIADKLGVQKYFWNTDLIWDNENELSSFNYEPDQDTKKLAQLDEFINSIKISTEECAVVGDSKNDVKLFQETKHGVYLDSGIENAPELEKIAWKKIKNLKELTAIL